MVILMMASFTVLIPSHSVVGALTSHQTIEIYADADFNTSNGVSQGNGSQENPFIIENLEISGPLNRLITISDTRAHVVLRNILLTNSSGASSGIRLFNVENCSIINVTGIGLRYGINIDDSRNITISNCSFDKGYIDLETSQFIKVFNITIEGYGGTYRGIDLDTCGNVSIEECSINNTAYEGVLASSCNDVNIHANSISNTGRDGIRIYCHDFIGENFQVLGNSIHSCSGGMEFQKLRSVVVKNNTIDDNGRYHGIRIQNCSRVTLHDNSMEDGGLYLQADTLEDATIDFINNSLAGSDIIYWLNVEDAVVPKDAPQVFLVECRNCTIENSTFGWVYRPVNLLFSEAVLVSAVEVVDVYYGLFARGCNNVVIRDCRLSDVVIENCSDTRIQGNRFVNSSKALTPDGCTRLTVSNNHFSNMRIGIYDDRSWSRVRGDRVGYVFHNNTFTNVNSPFRCEGDTYIGLRITDNRITNAVDSRFYNAIITRSEISGNVLYNYSWTAFFISKFTEGTIHGNTIVNVSTAFRIDNFEDSNFTSNIISRCTKDEEAVKITGDRNRVIGNEISLCQDLAMRVGGADTVVYHNNFISNNQGSGSTDPAQVKGTTHPTCMFDDGEKGNYWSDYQARYPNAKNDGKIWDTPYEVAEYGGQYKYDRYPLVVPMDYEPPVPRAGEDIIIAEGTIVTFDGSASADNKAIILYVWTFDYHGDKVHLTGPGPTFLFDKPGTYLVTLNVSDAFGNWAIDKVKVTVEDILSPTADAGPDITVDQNTLAALDGTASLDTGTIVNYTWTIEFSSRMLIFYGESASLVCDEIGRFNISLNVRDSAGHTDMDWLVLTVRDIEPPTPVVNGLDLVPQHTLVRFDGSGSTDNHGIANHEWRILYDGSTEVLMGATVEFLFDLVGEFTVTLTVTDLWGNQANETHIITVFDVDPPFIDQIPDRIVYIRVSHIMEHNGVDDNVRIADLAWTFRYNGSDVVLEGARPEYVFEIPGIYTVTFNVSDTSGNIASMSFQLHVQDNIPPVAKAGPDRKADEDTQVFLEDGGSTDTVGIHDYTWEIDLDITKVTLDGPSVEFIFERPGSYTITLFVEDEAGNEASDKLTITIRDTTPPVTRLKVLEVDDSNRRTLDGSESIDNVGIVNWTWEIVFENEITHLYGDTVELHRTDPGDYKVTLTVRDAAGNEAYDSIVVTLETDEQITLFWWAIIAVIAVIAVLAVVVAIYSLKGSKEE